MARIINRLNELMHIVEITVETAKSSTLPLDELTPYIRNKLHLVLKVLINEVFPYKAGTLATQWHYWCLYSSDYMRRSVACDFDVILSHVIEGFLQILGDNAKWTKRLLDSNVITTTNHVIHTTT